jgi:hypothetical protein
MCKVSVCAFFGVLLTACIMAEGFAALARATQKTTWPEKYYNPKPSQGDLVLPMPCGSAMVFRKVVVAEGCCLQDRRFEIGGADDKERMAKFGYREGRQKAYIAGAFSDEYNGYGRYYYIAKYETTKDQYTVWTNAYRKLECPNPSDQGRIPIVGVSWFDAVEFSRFYTEWLQQNASNELPREGPEPGFLRLPTEIEWEYAARGGTKVPEAELLHPPVGKALSSYAVSYEFAEGEIQSVGLRRPNALGLHDMVGNAAEMTFVPFRLDHRGRPHGQAGGFVYRGGSFRTQLEELRISQRREVPYFKNGRAATRPTVGFRLVLTAPVIVSNERLLRLREEWNNLPALKLASQPALLTTARGTIYNVAQQLPDDKLRAQLETSMRALEKAHTEINEIQDRAVKALIRQGAFLASSVEKSYRRVRAITRVHDKTKEEFTKIVSKVKAIKTKTEEERNAKSKAKLIAILKDAETTLERSRHRVEDGEAILSGSLVFPGIHWSS